MVHPLVTGLYKNTNGKFTLELVTEAFELETSCLYLSSIIY